MKNILDYFLYIAHMYYVYIDLHDYTVVGDNIISMKTTFLLGFLLK